MVRVLLADPLAYGDEFGAALAGWVPDVESWRFPDGPADGNYDVLAVWKLEEPFPDLPESLKLVFCFGAGADHLVADLRIPAHLPIVRLIDDGQAAELADYACHAAFAFLLNDQKYRIDQAHGIWDPVFARRRTRADARVAVLGLGPIGSTVATTLAAAGFTVRAWSRTSRCLPGVETFSGQAGLADCVYGANILVNLLPLAPETVGILSAPLFARLTPGAYLVNLGRGGHLDEVALQNALDAGEIGCAFLDAFAEEPLPRAHWIWSHERVRITPHIGGLPTPAGAARSLAAAIEALRTAAPLPGLVRAAAATKTSL
ncbi:NAD(P)-dependent oxidoreductase [Kaistia algarum]|uniref:NAD(P)-dependent oxidoreductase n=1 Tax=Kaistia algarum TaxID=2083279 RepID=UPI0014024BD4|nr:NAD(P)-dependent oxidoreductase [Kaistia algarum]MCX5512740.1 NAD(P)-binding domain-containing protein [Kaistia algarum]